MCPRYTYLTFSLRKTHLLRLNFNPAFWIWLNTKSIKVMEMKFFSTSNNVIQIYETAIALQTRNCQVHKTLKYGWCTAQPKRHYFEFEQTLCSAKCCFWSVIFCNFHLPIPSVENSWDPERVSSVSPIPDILSSKCVYFPIVKRKSSSTILFLQWEMPMDLRILVLSLLLTYQEFGLLSSVLVEGDKWVDELENCHHYWWYFSVLMSVQVIGKAKQSAYCTRKASNICFSSADRWQVDAVFTNSPTLWTLEYLLFGGSPILYFHKAWQSHLQS